MTENGMGDLRVGTIVDGTFEIPLEYHVSFIELVGPHLIETRTHAPGCVYYALARDVLEEHVFHLIEGWSSRQALDAHLASARLRAVRAQFVRFPILNYRCHIYTVSDQIKYVPG
jgi:quinol monooxygenase YgiN